MAKGYLIAQVTVTHPDAYGTYARAADSDFILIEGAD
ncbi:DUF1330 domain-containing protein [Rhizobium ruizarguesonis]|jgi:uncharacterized protein (DUF1330 family)|nr:DUF1330 domain-containing protein [Rhizobium ruizarguesonis]